MTRISRARTDRTASIRDRTASDAPQKPKDGRQQDGALEEAATNEASVTRPKRHSKADTLLRLLKRRSGASIAQLTNATGWQAHSVRGGLSGTLKKKRALTIDSEKTDHRGRVYRIVGAA